jgi:hypothetical protein
MIERKKYKFAFANSRNGVRSVFSQFDSPYWQDLDEVRSFPETFIKAPTDAG